MRRHDCPDPAPRYRWRQRASEEGLPRRHAGCIPHRARGGPRPRACDGALSGGTAQAGGVISGPTLMSLSDTAAYALVLAHIGDQLMAVTSSLTMNFLRGAAPGDLYAEAEMLRLGRRNAVCDVRLWTEGPDRLAAQAVVTYALPAS